MVYAWPCPVRVSSIYRIYGDLPNLKGQARWGLCKDLEGGRDGAVKKYMDMDHGLGGTGPRRRRRVCQSLRANRPMHPPAAPSLPYPRARAAMVLTSPPPASHCAAAVQCHSSWGGRTRGDDDDTRNVAWLFPLLQLPRHHESGVSRALYEGCAPITIT
ncbi:hypothetical protein BDW22DRAFT_355835 [Trametopsis cervina]|nr:hypothetical protein BDW22DRAFT_355835 [Trametopsis cervina]